MSDVLVQKYLNDAPEAMWSIPGSLHQAHRPELADVVAAAELALDFPRL